MPQPPHSLIQRIKKPGGLKGLKGIRKGRWGRKLSKPKPIALKPEVPGVAVDPLEAAAAQGVQGTLPERIILKWLERRGYLYRVQVAELGGARSLGGMSLDFVVYGLAGLPVVLRVQGTYWHGPLMDRTALDDEQAGRLRLNGYLVVDLWEHEIYQAVLSHRLTEFVLNRIML